MPDAQDTQDPTLQWARDQIANLQAQPKIDTTGSPNDGTRQSWTSLFGDVLGGGQGPGYQLRGQEADTAGNRALLNFGINMLLASGPHAVKPDVLSAAAQGLQGAQQSLDVDQRRGAAAMGAQQEYQKNQQEMTLARIKEMIPLLTLQQQMQQAQTARQLAGGGGGNIATGGSIAAPTTFEGAIAGHEGTGKNPNSSATGVGQFLDSTWQGFTAANPDLFKGMTPEQVQAARNDPAIGAKAINWLAQQNASVLQAAGVTPSGTSLGIAHYVGAKPAAAIMAAPDSALVKNFVSEAAVKANPELATMTAGQLRARYANTPNPGFLTATAAKPPGVTPATVAAAPGVQQGGAPPPPPGAPAGNYAGGGFGEVLSPVAPNRGGSQYTVAPPPVVKQQPIFPAGKRTADAIMEGVQQAQATPGLPGGVMTAGPGAPTATATATPATPEPGWGTGGGAGSYGVGTFGGATAPAAPTPTAPVATPTQPTTPPPSPYPDIKAGEGIIRHPGEPAEYFARESVPPPQTELYNPNLSPATQAYFAAKAQAIEEMYRGMGTHSPAEQPAISDKVREARANLQAEIAQATQEKALAASTATEKYNEQQRKDIEARYALRLGAYNTAAQGQLTGGQKLAEINAQAGATERTAALNPINTEAGAAAHRLDDLQVLKGFSNNLGDPTFLTSQKIGGHSLADIISGAGLGSQALQDKAGQAQAFQAAALSIVRDLRMGGAAAGEPRSNQDLQFITSMVPSEMQSPATRNAIISYIEQVNQRRMEYGAEVGRLVNTPEFSNNVGGAMLAARKAMPDIVQTVPKEIAYGGGDVAQQRLDWFRKNVPPGSFYRAPNGRMQVWHGVKGDPDYAE